MSRYFDELKHAMDWLGRQDDVMFLGQAVAAPGTAMSNTLCDVSLEKRIELPVVEEMQMGMSLGMSLSGLVPVTVYPRWNFLLLATNQLVNHVDKMAVMSHGEFVPRLIIRTSVGSERPLHPQHQHVGDFTDAFRSMLSCVEVIRLEDECEIMPAYMKAYHRSDGRPTVIVEIADRLND